ncbi:Plasmodium variant antigen protein Cir/Yir/Bir, putative, partial [Plasmodium chabaudi chabaudi]
FNDENVDTEKINKDITINGYCRNGVCKTNEESISALTAYIFKKFKDSIVIKQKYNHYDECLLMWVSDKLFKVHLKSIDKKDVNNYMDGTTLNQAYKNYLEKHKGIFDYWDLFNIIGDLKEANLKYMAEFYRLLHKICKIITGYNNKSEIKKIYKYPADCSHQYKNLYLNIYQCKPYLDLLNKLKGIYDDFSSDIKKKNSNPKLATKLKKLTPQDGKEMAAVRGFKTYNISNTKCKLAPQKNTNPKKAVKSSLQHSNQLKGRQHETQPTQKPEIKDPKLQSAPESEPEPKPKPAPVPAPSPAPAPPSPKEPQPETQQSSSITSPEDPPAKQELHSSSQESQELGKNNQNALTDSGKETGGSKREIKGPDVGNEKKNGGDKEPGTPSGGEGSQVDGGDRANSESGGADTEKSGAESGSADKVSETGDLGKGKGVSKGGTGDVPGGDQGSPGSGTRDTNSVQGGVPGGQISNGNQGSANTSQQGSEGSDGKGGKNSQPGGSSSGSGGTGSKVGGSNDGSGDTDNGPGNLKSQQIDQSTTQDNSLKQNQRSGSLGSNPQEKTPDSQKETQPSSSDPQKVSTSSPEPQQTPTPLPATPQVEKQDSPSPPKCPEQTKDDKEKTPPIPGKESSQPQLPNSTPSQEPKLGGDKNTPDISQTGQSGEQKDPDGDTENQDRPQGDLKTQDQTPVTSKGGSDDGLGGGSEDSKGGTGDTDKGPPNTGGGKNDKDGSGGGLGGGPGVGPGGVPGSGSGGGPGGEPGGVPGSGSGSGSGSEQGSQGGSGGTGSEGGGSDNGQGVKDSEGGGPDSKGGGTGSEGGGTGSEGGGTGGGQGGTDGNQGGSGGSGEQGSKNGGSDDQGSNSGGSDDQGSNSDGSSNLWNPFLKFVINGMDQFNKASKFVDENQQKLKDSMDKINSAYNEVKDSLKNFYDQSKNHFSDFINNITDEFKQVNIPSKPGNLDNKPPQNSDKPQQSGDSPQPPPKDKSEDPPSQLPTSPPPTPPSTPQSGPPKDPQPNGPQPKQPVSQSQPTTHQTTQDDPSNQKKTDKTNLQLVKSPSPDLNLKKTWNIFPTTWNGSKDCKPEITFMNTTLVCCTSKQCSITGIPIILVLIPIILLIVCKYLSSEWRKEMTRKKNMTKVINVVGVNKTTKMVINSSDGKKQIQIIIKSSGQKKQTKKSINSVNRKKSPSLNIYQLMQADPVPFINLIFLLIFFVYKRKRDFIE